LSAAGEDRVCLREIGGEFHWASSFDASAVRV